MAQSGSQSRGGLERARRIILTPHATPTRTAEMATRDVATYDPCRFNYNELAFQRSFHRKHGSSGVFQLLTASPLGESRKKSRCDAGSVRGNCGAALGI